MRCIPVALRSEGVRRGGGWGLSLCDDVWALDRLNTGQLLSIGGRSREPAESTCSEGRPRMWMSDGVIGQRTRRI